MKKKISTLARDKLNIEYELIDGKFKINWDDKTFYISNEEINAILDVFFCDKRKWYPLGATFDKPMKGGLGEFLRDELRGFTPRYASAVAAILVNEGYLIAKGRRPIYLRRT